MNTSARLPRSDVCVVGSGPAGITTSLALADAGRTVLLIESGGEGRSRSAQRLNAGETVGDAYSGLTATRHRRLGGTVHIWNVELDESPLLASTGIPGGRRGAKYVPLSARDLVAWPIDLDELRPWYARAQRICGLGPLEYGADHWARGPRKPFDLGGTGLTTAIYQFGTGGRFVDQLVQDLRRSDAVTIAPRHTVVGLDLDARGRRCTGVRAVGPGGGTVVHASSVVLACGAVENARLLMASGMARRSGWLGRGFMEHARDFSMELEPDDPGVFADAGFYDLHLGEDGTPICGRLAPTDGAIDEYDLPNASITLVPRSRPIAGRGPIAALRRRWKARAGRYWSGRHGWSGLPDPAATLEAFRLVVNLEHLPAADNRIELAGPPDAFGTPLPRLHLRWGEAEQARLERFRRLLSEWFAHAGLGRLHVVPGHRPDLSAHHHAGTTRMSADADEGVVDPDGRVFGSDNVFVAGASTFPTAGFANPTLTIVATALRTADRVSRELG